MSQKQLELPQDFQVALLRYLKTHYLKGKGKTPGWNRKDVEYFAKGIVSLNQNFTSNRAGRYKDYFNDPTMRSGYLAYFLPVNAAKTYGILKKHVQDFNWPSKVRIADIGSGPLTLSFGFLFLLIDQVRKTDKKVHVTIDAFELNKKMVWDGAALMQDFIDEAKLTDLISLNIKPRVGNFFKTKVTSTDYDLVLLGNFLNEFDERDDQWKIVSKTMRSFCNGGTKVLFMEPGSKKISRDLQNLRDLLITEMEFKILGPCLHHHGCPLNITAKGDWCNFSQGWRTPGFIESFDQITSLKKAYLVYSYLFVEQGLIPKEQPSLEDFVAISDVMRQKGRDEVIGCGEAGRLRFVRSNADKSESNNEFGWIRRGKLFSTPFYKHSGAHVINKNVPVKKSDVVLIKMS